MSQGKLVCILPEKNLGLKSLGTFVLIKMLNWSICSYWMWHMITTDRIQPINKTLQEILISSKLKIKLKKMSELHR